MLRQFTITCAMALGIALVVAGSAAAGGDDFDGFVGDEDSSGSDSSGSGVSGGVESGELRVRVEVSGSTGEGESYTATRSVGVAPMCWYERGWSGREYFEFRTSEGYQHAQRLMPEHYRSIPYPNFEAYAEVDDGYWFVPRCRSSVDYDYLREFLDTRPPVFWTPGDGPAPSVVDVDPRVLAEVAYDLVEIPTGEIDWNPKAGGVGAAVVNTDTWVWVTDAVEQVTARASVPSGTWAQVTAQVATIDVTAQGADPVTCPGLGTPWTRHLSPASGCAVVFTRSSAHLGPDQAVPTATMTVTATWEASWTSSMHTTPQPLPAQQTTVTTQIPVAEIQTLVTIG